MAFHSQREANLTSYMADINLSTAYKNALRAGFIEGMKSRVKFTKDEVSFVVTRIDVEPNVAVGLISRIVKQNIWEAYQNLLFLSQYYLKELYPLSAIK